MGQNLIKSISLRKISFCFVLDKFSSKVVCSPFGHNFWASSWTELDPPHSSLVLKFKQRSWTRLWTMAFTCWTHPIHLWFWTRSTQTRGNHAAVPRSCMTHKISPEINWLRHFKGENDKPCSPWPPSHWALAKRERWWVISWSDLHCFPFVWFWSSSFICIFILLLPQLQKWYFEV